ncbi:hypothetical protein GlitD10_2462 [Gloeomargarita lithophora Alchichica-D10]|uniref:Uncharacterized protein n=1 Tax=Gloeomargarita lithophora Alchichica-D10 TaxID=1188229 RepID=A0A1J0AFT1_9CYAN|nr:hypothetical protein [Gloeomargarita lithophora]APB34798.1 hypothetical protein GlitD10_2462 [Gloeomargarita lithophora Alchichica-D10]
MNLFVLWCTPPQLILAQNPPEPPPEESWLALISLVASLVQGLIFLLGFTFSGLVLIGQGLASLFSLALGLVWTPLQGILTALVLPFFATGVGMMIPVVVIVIVVLVLAA